MAAAECNTVNPSSQPIPLSQGSGTAPVCEGSHPENIGAGTGITLPSIPTAVDLPSALAAINALAMGFRLLTNQTKTAPRSMQPGHGVTNSVKSKNPGTNKQGRWNESARTTQVVRVTNPEDATQFVDVKQINSLTMKDSQTGEQWQWKR